MRHDLQQRYISIDIYDFESFVFPMIDPEVVSTGSPIADLPVATAEAHQVQSSRINMASFVETCCCVLLYLLIMNVSKICRELKDVRKKE